MLILPLPYPPSVNTYWRHVGHRVLISAGGRAYRSKVGEAVAQKRAQGVLGHGPMAGRLAVHAVAYMPDNRGRDLDNLPKAVLDALTHAGVWKDDAQIDDLRILRGEIVDGGALIVTIKPIAARAAA